MPAYDFRSWHPFAAAVRVSRSGYYRDPASILIDVITTVLADVALVITRKSDGLADRNFATSAVDGVSNRRTAAIVCARMLLNCSACETNEVPVRASIYPAAVTGR